MEIFKKGKHAYKIRESYYEPDISDDRILYIAVFKLIKIIERIPLWEYIDKFLTKKEAIEFIKAN